MGGGVVGEKLIWCRVRLGGREDGWLDGEKIR